MQGIWQQVPPATFATLGLIDAALLAASLLMACIGSRAFGLDRADEVAIVFCGSQKSLVSGIPIASVLFAGPTMGLVVLPIMIYYPMQLLVCAGLARRYAMAPVTADAPLPATAEIGAQQQAPA